MSEFDGVESVRWTDIWAEATEELGNSDEVRHMIEAASGRSGASWLITLDTPAPVFARKRVREMVDRRLKGEPLQYIVGRWGFRNLDLKVDQRVLIPRPETEQVTETAIALIRNTVTPFVADLGTGSGAIALSIAVEVPTARVCATDMSEDALTVARENLAMQPISVTERVRFLGGSWFDALPPQWQGKLDLVVSNPPYVADHERAQLSPEVAQWEPHAALFSGPDGLNDVRHIIATAPQWLKRGGGLVIEIAPHQADAVEQLAQSAAYKDVAIGVDLAGRRRWLQARTDVSA